MPCARSHQRCGPGGCIDPLPGASPPDERALRSTLDAATARHLAELYGGEAGDLLGYAASFPEALERVHPAARTSGRRSTMPPTRSGR